MICKRCGKETTRFSVRAKVCRDCYNESTRAYRAKMRDYINNIAREKYRFTRAKKRAIMK